MGRKSKSPIEVRDGIEGRNCVDCLEWLTLDNFTRNKVGAGGVRSVCRECDKARVRNYRKQNPEKYKEASKRYNAENAVQRREYGKLYRETHKEETSERLKKWRRNNPDHIKKYTLAYLKENKEESYKRSKNWVKNNKERVLLYYRNRRAKKRLLLNDFTIQQQEEVLRYFDGGCALTGDTNEIHWDHIIPVSIGHGGTTYGNMIPLRADLNISKKDWNIFEWFEANRQRFNLSQQKFEDLVFYLAKANGVTVKEYRDHVYWCFENRFYYDENGEVV